MSDISQDFRPADILGVPQAIKGFDKLDFCEVLNVLYCGTKSRILTGNITEVMISRPVYLLVGQCMFIISNSFKSRLVSELIKDDIENC